MLVQYHFEKAIAMFYCLFIFVAVSFRGRKMSTLIGKEANFMEEENLPSKLPSLSSCALFGILI